MEDRRNSKGSESAAQAALANLPDRLRSMGKGTSNILLAVNHK